ncbi:MAG: LPXTG cell wall anchor domain-containing protein [Thermoanaerobaculia bacterium]
MKYLKAILTSMAFLGLANFALAQGATPVQRNTKISISEPTEIAGTILQPGTYTIKVVDFKTGKVQVQVSDKDDKSVITTVTAMRLRRNLDTNQQQANQAEFTYTTANGHPALKTWFYPGDEWGEEFQTGKATWVAENTATVTQTPMQTETKTTEVAEAPAPAPTPAPETVAENNAPAPEAAPAELPKTASDLPLLGLVGVLALGAAAGVHLLRK